MLFGYTQVSRKDQNTDLQNGAFLKYGVEEKNIQKNIVFGAATE
jgi:DNA invertase Pin-like site-specific DNA recombinase